MGRRSARRQSNRQSRSQSRSQRQSKRQTRKQRYGKPKVKKTKSKRNNKMKGGCGCAVKAAITQTGGFWGGATSSSYIRNSYDNQVGGGWGASSTTYVGNPFGNQVGGGGWPGSKKIKKLPGIPLKFFTRYL